jgi:pilus assembly protein FimV
MPRGPYPLLLTLAMTLSGRVDAVGLGDIHVDSALNEPLSAQIEIVGASAEDLVELKAAVADRETFQRYGAEYPAFLSTANFKVARDPEGRPILAVHSDQAFTEPLVSLLVDLRWRHGKLIREYSLLLDPAGMADTHRAAELAAADTEDAPLPETPPAAAAKVAAVTQRVEPETAPAAVPHDVRAQGTIAHHRITGKDTLRGIVRRAGARSESTVQRMMIAIFRANPSAFEGNINRLRKGATLTMPGAEAWAAISAADARREVQIQMAAWHDSAARVGKTRTAPTVAVANTTLAPPESHEPTAALNQRVQTLEQALGDLKGLLAAEQAKLAGIQQWVGSAATAPQQAAAPATTPARSTHSPAPERRNLRLIPIAAGLGILIAGFAVMRRRRVGERAHSSDSHGTPDNTVESPARADSEVEPIEAPASEAPKQVETVEASQDLPLDTSATATMPVEPPPTATSVRTADGETTVNLAIDTVALEMPEFDTTAQHVQMPSVLHEHVVVGERRTNIVRILTTAIEREPHRRDLRLKLLEVYYAAASSNRQAFLEVARILARDRDHLTADEWEKLVRMGRDFAADDASFADLSDADDTIASELIA